MAVEIGTFKKRVRNLEALNSKNDEYRRPQDATIKELKLQLRRKGRDARIDSSSINTALDDKGVYPLQSGTKQAQESESEQ